MNSTSNGWLAARKHALFVACSMLVACGCHELAAVSGRWVYVGGAGSAGVAAAPVDGGPLTLAETHECLDDAQLLAKYGATCDRHEPEVPGTADMSGDFQPGLHPTPGQVRWYCACPIVARITLERCDGGDSFRVSQVALATQGGCQ